MGSLKIKLLPLHPVRIVNDLSDTYGVADGDR
jgi:hypothetical protein